jgi:membrane fusion protein, multidrug efflux system
MICRRLGAIAITAAALLPLFACADKKAAKQGPPPSVPVTVATVLQKDIPVQVTSIGTVEPFSAVAIKAQVNGQITGVHFNEGQDVKAGDLLFTLDRRPFEAELRRAESTQAKDQAQLANARAQAARYAELQKQGVVAREQADTVITNAQALEATVDADKAMVESAQVQLQYCTITAPIAGRTGNLMVHAGNLVKANDTPALVTINQISPIYAEFAVPEQALSQIKKYMAGGKLAVLAVLPNEPPISGVLSFVDNAVDSATGTIKLKGTFANAERKLWPGQFVNMVLTLTTENNAVVVPAQAIQTGQQGQYVFVVKSNKTAEQRIVVVERIVQNEVVVRSGLQPGETVVTDGQVRLVPGSPVEIKSANNGQPQSSSAPAVGSQTDQSPAAGAAPQTANSAPARSRQEGQ